MVHGDPTVLRIAVQRHRNLLDPYLGFSLGLTLRTQILPKVAVIKIIFGLDSGVYGFDKNGWNWGKDALVSVNLSGL